MSQGMRQAIKKHLDEVETAEISCNICENIRISKKRGKTQEPLSQPIPGYNEACTSTLHRDHV